MTPAPTADLDGQCDQLRSLHRPGSPLLLPNAWDVATARAVVAAGFPAVATTSAGVAATLGYEDHEHAPGRGDARRRRADRTPGRGSRDRRRRGRLRDAAFRVGRRAPERGGRRLQSRGHRLRRRRSARSRPPRGLAPGGSPGRGGGRLPARDQRTGRCLPRPVPRRRRPRDPKRSSFRKRCGARMPTSRPASTACFRSACGRRTRCAASLLQSVAR